MYIYQALQHWPLPPLPASSALCSSKTGLVTTAWDRLYFFTQGGNLMCQPRGAVAGGMVLDLDNSSVMAVECEDRRYCFQITSPSGKTYVYFSTFAIRVILNTFRCILCNSLYFFNDCRSMILQAESKKEYEEVSVKAAVHPKHSFCYKYLS